MNEMEQADEVAVELLPHQADFVADTTSPYLVLEGGLGSGKTVALVVKMLQLAQASPGVPGLIVEPTSDLIGSIFLPTVEELFGTWGIPFDYRTQYRGRVAVLLIWPGTSAETVVYLRSGDKPQRIVGFKVGWFLLDEVDQLKADVWRRCIGRWRDSRAKVMQAVAVGTPEEGFNWTFERFHVKPAPGTRVIQGVSTRANVFLPKDYADHLAANHDEDELARVLTGKRTTRTGLVYKRFDRTLHCRPCDNPIDGELFIGADFNVSAMAWVFGRRLGSEIHIFGELVRENTDTMAQAEEAAAYLARMFKRVKGIDITPMQAARRCQVVPDASAAARRTSATDSDVQHLIRCGFDVRRPATNPPIKDRIFSVNLAFAESRLFVDPDRCPTLLRCIEQQGYAKDGMPDKSKGLDHAPDALGYAVHWYEPAHAFRGNQAAHADMLDRFRNRNGRNAA